ncbi:tannase/feruloyl esterase family alpha/beta hydrolase [Pelagerythrobacter marensis]|uniref:Tannase/feruloyl esterase family alpha/beta hydrolase n=1 Tax=Pelagerythrobacter marensis TaxID=543877 RepID=A0ABZ2D3Q3_9SPHN
MPGFSLIALLAAMAAPSQTETSITAPVGNCAALIGESGDVKVERATPIDPDPLWTVETDSFYRGLPVSVSFCRVEGTIEGNIGFEMWLPLKWNGRMLGAGVGGDAGRYNFTDMSLRVEQGFATITTDGGHKAGQARWMSDPKAREDYTHRAVHLTAQAGKAIAARFYAQPVRRSYFTGCSGGGRQALKEMQRYPGDYDGVIAGAPGPYMPLQSVRMLWFALEQQRNPKAALREQDWALYEAEVTRKCDADDGVHDGIVENPASCDFALHTLLCRPGEDDKCISAPRLAMLESIVSPMPDEHGQAMDSGLFPGVRTRPGPPSPLLRAMWADGVYDDPDWDEMTFRRTADLAMANEAMPELRADSVAIDEFVRRGGKAILYQGWQDPSTNAGPTIEYYARLARANGGLTEISQSARLFMVPGMYHCRGGPGADLFGASGHRPLANGADPSRDILWALIRWVEDGKAPQELVAARNLDSAPGFTRKLCPFPQIARYDGEGPTRDAASYRCVTDPVLARFLTDGG